MSIHGKLSRGHFWQPGVTCEILDEQDRSGISSLRSKGAEFSFLLDLEPREARFFRIKFGPYTAPFLIPRGWDDFLVLNEVLVPPDIDVASRLLTFTAGTLAMSTLKKRVLFVRGGTLSGFGHAAVPGSIPIPDSFDPFPQPGLYSLADNDLTDLYALKIVLHVWNSQPESPFERTEVVAARQKELMDAFHSIDELRQSWSNGLAQGQITKQRFRFGDRPDAECLEASLDTVKTTLSELFPAWTMFPKIFNVESWGQRTGIKDPGHPLREIRGQLFVFPEYSQSSMNSEGQLQHEWVSDYLPRIELPLTGGLGPGPARPR